MEKIEAQPLVRQGPPTVLEPLSQTATFGGGASPKHLIEGEVAGRPVSLVQREYEPRYVKMWHAYREAGLPVVPTLREATVEDRRVVLLTDLKADGSELFGKGMAVMVAGNDPSRERPPHPAVDKRFMELTKRSNFQEVVARANDYAQRANEHGLVLPTDDAFELRIRPDGSWDLIILDLYWGSSKADDKSASDEWVAKTNAQSTRDFLSNLRVIREHLEPGIVSRTIRRLGNLARRH